MEIFIVLFIGAITLIAMRAVLRRDGDSVKRFMREFAIEEDKKMGWNLYKKMWEKDYGTGVEEFIPEHWQ